MNKDTFDASKEEEFDDSQGNVLARRDTYEELAKQGLVQKYDWIHYMISQFIIPKSASSIWYEASERVADSRLGGVLHIMYSGQEQFIA